MKMKSIVPFLLGIAIAVSPMLRAQNSDHHDRGDHHGSDDNANTPLALVGVIGIPGNPIASTDIAHVDQASERLYFTDRNNGPSTPTPAAGATTHGAIDVIDAENDLFIGRITTGTVGGTAVYFAGANAVNRNIGGPNGVVSGAGLRVWAGDGDDTVKAADVDPTSPTYLQIIASVLLANRTAVSMCGTTCQRADELAYDPADHIIMVATDAPVSIPPYASFVNADFPYNLLGQINFAAQGLGVGGGLEQPLWIPSVHRFFQTLPTANADGTGKIAVVNPLTRTVERTINLDQFGCSPTGEALGADDHVVVSCGSFPLVIDLHGGEIGPGITQVGGGDEVNYNPGDGRFIVSSNVAGNSANPVVLGVISAESGGWLQNVPLPNGLQPGSIRAGNLAAFGENNHVFVIVHPPTAAEPPPPDPTVCASFGWVNTGCVAVFTHTGEERDENGDSRDGR